MAGRISAMRSRYRRARGLFLAAATLTTTGLLGTGAAQADVYSFQWDRPPGFDGLAGPIFADDSAGALNSLTLSYDSDDERLTLLAAFAPEPGSGNLPDGFSLVLNNGPSAVGEPGRYAVLHFRAAHESQDPILSAFVYNGAGKDGASRSYRGRPDRIISSRRDSDWVHWASVVDGPGGRVLSFDIDVSTINSHVPRHGDPADWFGIGFDDTIGMWMTPYARQWPGHPDHNPFGMDDPRWWMGGWRWGRGFGPFVDQGSFDFADLSANRNVNIPAPATLGLIGLGGIALMSRDRRAGR